MTLVAVEAVSTMRPRMDGGVKLQGGRPLNRNEKQAVAHLKVSGGSRVKESDGDGFADRVLKRARVTENGDQYILIPAVAPTQPSVFLVLRDQ
jgi:hypothetical protein